MINHLTLKRFRIGFVLVALLVTTLIAAPVVGQTDAPTGITIPYSGQLTGENGKPVVNGTYDFTFAIYDAVEGGTLLWSEAQADVSVQGGVFAVVLGNVHLIPDSVQNAELWLDVNVRGPQDKAATTLDPRQQVNITSPAAVSNSLLSGTCAHDHLGETWNWYGSSKGLTLSGNVPWANGLLYVQNGSNGPSIWGVNVGGGNAVRGDGYGSSIGVYGEGASGPGVAGNSATGDGMSGGSSGYEKSGVYGHHDATNFGYGVYGISESGRGVMGVDGGTEPDNSYAVYAQGDIRTTDDLMVDDTLTVTGMATFGGGKTGYVVDFAQNDDTVPLVPGDVVVISGFGPAVAGEIPVIKVRRATTGESGAVVGVVDQHYVPPATTVQVTRQEEVKAESVADNDAILPGEYLTVVTLGSFKIIKVDAAFGAIQPGDLLVSSPNPGYAMRSDAPKPGTIIGKALGELLSGTGFVPVIVTLQ